MIERDPGAVDLTEAGGVAGNFCHQGRFTEAHFAQTLGKTVIPIYHTNPSGGANGELAEWKQEWAGGGHAVET